jgi:hypothetical protein
MFLTSDWTQPSKLPWYKNYGFNTEQEFEQWWAKYGGKLKLKFPAVSASAYSSYEEYLQKQAIDSVKRAFQSPSPCLFGKSLKIKTSDGKTWTFLTAYQDVYYKWHCRGLLGDPRKGTANPTDELYALCWLATSPLIVSIEASDQVIEVPTRYGRPIYEEALKLGQQGIVTGYIFPAFWIWIMSGRIPLTLTQISKDFPMDQHPPVVPPPYSITPGTVQSSPATGGTTTGGTTSGGTSTGSTTTGGTTTEGTTTTGGTTTTAVVKSALPYLAIGAGVLLLLWAMKK